MTVADPAQAMQTTHPAVAGTRPMTAEVLWSVPRVGAAAVSPDGALVAVPVTTYAEADGAATTRIWLVDTRTGDARPITTEESSSRAPVFAPEGGRLAFLRDKPGEGDREPVPQIWLLPLDGGEAECVTDLPLGCLPPRWMPDGDGLVFGAWLDAEHLEVEATRRAQAEAKPVRVHATERRFYRFWDRWLTEARVPHLFHLDLETGALVDLMPESTLAFDLMSPGDEYDLAPDGSSVVYAASDVSDDARGYLRWDVYRVDLAGGAPVCLTAENPAQSVRPRFSPDGAGILYGRTEDPHFYADRCRLWWIDTETGEHSPVLTAWDRGPGAWAFAPSGDLYLQADDEGGTRIFVLPASDLHPGGDEETETAPTPVTRRASATDPAPAGDGHVFFTRASLSEPPEIWRAGLRGGEPVRLTWFTRDALADVARGEVRDVRYAGAAGREIQGLLVLPPDGADGAPHPTLVMVHGGPHGILGDTWHWRWHAQTMAARGYAVFVPQFHGSTSYGTEFARCIQGALGAKPLEDVLAGVDALVEAGLADPDRLAIGGGSYGGYLTCWATTRTDRFACAVNHAGVFDHGIQWASDHTYGLPRAQGGTPYEDQAAVDRHDPSRHTQGWDTPMLVLHGGRDHRVPSAQALACYGILKAKGVPARLVFFPDENHWVLDRANSLRWYEEVLAWLDRWLSAAAGT